MNEDIIVSDEFKDFCLQLTDEEKEQLETNILEDGQILDPFIIWKDHNILVDGHNRWDIHLAHPEIPYSVEYIEFEDEPHVKLWMINHQKGRRNWSPIQKGYMEGEEYNLRKQLHGGDHGNQYTKSAGVASPQNEDLPQNQNHRLSHELAEKYGESHTTIERNAEMAKAVDEANEISPGFTAGIMSGEINSTKSELTDINKVSEEQKPTYVEAIKSNDKKTVNKIREDEGLKSINKSETSDIDVDEKNDKSLFDEFDNIEETIEESSELSNNNQPPLNAEEFTAIMEDIIGLIEKNLNQIYSSNDEYIYSDEGKRIGIEIMKHGKSILDNFINKLK